VGWVGVPLEDVGDGAGVHEQALGELQRHHLRIRLYESQQREMPMNVSLSTLMG
jgi:hypothetical protein